MAAGNESEAPGFVPHAAACRGEAVTPKGDMSDEISPDTQALPATAAAASGPGVRRGRVRPREADGLARTAYGLFITLIIVTLLNVPSRIHALGYLRPTVLLVGSITGLLFFSKSRAHDRSHTSRLLIVLVVYVFLEIPFAEWPGSAVNKGLEPFIKAVVFFFFPLFLIDDFKRLRQFITVVTACQVFRILEPLFLHVTTGYWGSRASMAGWQYMDRLSGAPHDIINPNGLAFVIMTALPFLHYLLGCHRRLLYRFVYVVLLPLLLYTLVLTGSRSGMVGLVIVYFFVLSRSKHKFALIAGALVGMVFMVNVMNADQKDRYLSLVSDNTRNSGTREGRIEGVQEELRVAMRRPLFGYGIGTSREANANFRGVDQLSHDLYTEVFIELGFVGLVIFLAVLVAILKDVMAVKPAVRRIWKLARSCGLTSRALIARLRYYQRCADAIFVFAAMCIVFSLASYGLSEFYWYLIAGMSVSICNVVRGDSDLIARISRASRAEDGGEAAGA